MNPILIAISATLNTGNFMIFKFIKSTTKPLNILSIPLPIVPPSIKLYEHRSNMSNVFFLNIKKISNIENKILIKDKNILLPLNMLNAAP